MPSRIRLEGSGTASVVKTPEDPAEPEPFTNPPRPPFMLTVAKLDKLDEYSTRIAPPPPPPEELERHES